METEKTYFTCDECKGEFDITVSVKGRCEVGLVCSNCIDDVYSRQHKGTWKPTQPIKTDENTLDYRQEAHCDSIDAAFFTGLPTEADLQRYEFFMNRWRKRAVIIREIHAETPESDGMTADEFVDQVLPTMK